MRIEFLVKEVKEQCIMFADGRIVVVKKLKIVDES